MNNKKRRKSSVALIAILIFSLVFASTVFAAGTESKTQIKINSGRFLYSEEISIGVNEDPPSEDVVISDIPESSGQTQEPEVIATLEPQPEQTEAPEETQASFEITTDSPDPVQPSTEEVPETSQSEASITPEISTQETVETTPAQQVEISDGFTSGTSGNGGNSGVQTGTYSSNMIQMPSVAGQPYSSYVKSNLEAIGFVVEVVEVVDSSYASGYVINQSIPAGGQAVPGSVVTLGVSVDAVEMQQETTSAQISTSADGSVQISATSQLDTDPNSAAVNMQLDSYKNIGVVLNSKPEKFGSLYWPLPAEYGMNALSSGYGFRTGQYSGFHAGLDLACPEGTEIYACQDGVVVASYYSDSAGNFTIIQHEDGLYTEYMHQSVRYVKAGEKVRAGQLIGLVGSTGWSTGPHLHIGVVISENGYDINKRVDPTPYLTHNGLTTLFKPYVVSQDDMVIDYSGGTKITESAVEDGKLISKLSPVITSSGILKTSYAGFTRKGYFGTEGTVLKEKNAIGLGVSPGYKEYDDTWVRYETDNYDLLVKIVATYNTADEKCPLTVRLDAPSVAMDWSVCAEDDLSEPFYKEIPASADKYFSVCVHVELYKHGTRERADISEVYQAIKDIDQAQSYSSPNELFSEDTLIIKDKKSFEQNLNDNGESSYLGKDGQIYSGFKKETLAEVESPWTADIYRKLDFVHVGGIDLIFGYKHAEATGIDLYTPQQTILVNSAKGNGTGRDALLVNKGQTISRTPAVSSEEEKTTAGWKADRDVTLKDGTTIKQGDVISADQIQQVVVDDDMTLEAMNR